MSKKIIKKKMRAFKTTQKMKNTILKTLKKIFVLSKNLNFFYHE